MSSSPRVQAANVPRDVPWDIAAKFIGTLTVLVYALGYAVLASYLQHLRVLEFTLPAERYFGAGAYFGLQWSCFFLAPVILVVVTVQRTAEAHLNKVAIPIAIGCALASIGMRVLMLYHMFHSRGFDSNISVILEFIGSGTGAALCAVLVPVIWRRGGNVPLVMLLSGLMMVCLLLHARTYGQYIFPYSWSGVTGAGRSQHVRLIVTPEMGKALGRAGLSIISGTDSDGAIVTEDVELVFDTGQCVIVVPKGGAQVQIDKRQVLGIIDREEPLPRPAK